MADVARNASFPEDEVGLHKQNRKQALMRALANPAYLANRKFNELVYGKHPYAHVGPPWNRWTSSTATPSCRSATVTWRRITPS